MNRKIRAFGFGFPILLFPVTVFIMAFALRTLLIPHQSLWRDEIFSIAMATGHSLEHPANVANPKLGDYVEPTSPVPATKFREYMSLDSESVSFSRVIRAVALSDSSPPLYYLLLHVWFEFFGTADIVLSYFSLLWAMACFPVIWAIASRVANYSTAFLSVLFFSLVPLSVNYSLEGRHYSLLMFESVVLILASLRLNEKGLKDWKSVLIWFLSAVFGLYTHYFFAFILAASTLWLFAEPGKVRRRELIIGMSLVLVFVLPWYARVPGFLSQWRITKGWQNAPHLYPVVETLIRAFKKYFGAGRWDARLGNFTIVAAALYLIRISWQLRRIPIPTPKFRLIGLCCVSPLLGLLAFDIWQGTACLKIERYSLAGLPFFVILLAAGVSRLKPYFRGAALALICGIWGSSYVYYFRFQKEKDSYQKIAAAIETQGIEQSLLIINTLPSDALGIARYIHPSTKMISWIDKLQTRELPRDLVKVTQGQYQQIFLIPEPTNPELLNWLSSHAKLLSERESSVRALLRFAP